MNDKMKAEFDVAFVKKFGFGRMLASASADAHQMLNAAEWAWEAAAPPQPIYDEAKELKRFRDWRRKTTRPECNYDPHRELIMSEAWRARAKAGEDE